MRKKGTQRKITLAEFQKTTSEGSKSAPAKILSPSPSWYSIPDQGKAETLPSDAQSLKKMINDRDLSIARAQEHTIALREKIELLEREKILFRQLLSVTEVMKLCLGRPISKQSFIEARDEAIKDATPNVKEEILIKFNRLTEEHFRLCQRLREARNDVSHCIKVHSSSINEIDAFHCALKDTVNSFTSRSGLETDEFLFVISDCLFSFKVKDPKHDREFEDHMTVQLGETSIQGIGVEAANSLSSFPSLPSND